MILTEDKNVESFVNLCRKLGIRGTPQRVVIFKELSATQEHPAAETIYESVKKTLPTISLNTVYKTLAFLESRRLVWTVATVGGRARYDATTSPHYHFICHSCKSVTDIFSKGDGAFCPPKEAMKLGAIKTVNVQLHGMCNCCIQKKENKN